MMMMKMMMMMKNELNHITHNNLTEHTFEKVVVEKIDHLVYLINESWQSMLI